MFNNPFSYSGRIRRMEYWLSLSIVFNLMVLGLVTCASLFPIGRNEFVDHDTENRQVLIAIIVWLLFSLISFLFILPQSVKRSHDIGNSGWWVLVPFYPLLLLFIPGQKGKNQYGDDPKQE